MQLRRLAIASIAVLSTAGLSACGNKQSHVSHAETEGQYVSVGNLKYQVQISRALNPANIEDKGYLIGLSSFDTTLGADNVWFAVFIRVENDTQKAGLSAKTFQLSDTQGNTFTPIVLGKDNVYAYHPEVVPAHNNVNGVLPDPDSPASEGPTQGALLLFKVPRASLVNRPLVLTIDQPDGHDRATVDLDV